MDATTMKVSSNSSAGGRLPSQGEITRWLMMITLFANSSPGCGSSEIVEARNGNLLFVEIYDHDNIEIN